MCLGDDRSDEDMFLALKIIREMTQSMGKEKEGVAAKDLREGKKREGPIYPGMGTGIGGLEEEVRMRENGGECSKIVEGGFVSRSAKLFSCRVGLKGEYIRGSQATHADFQLDSSSQLVRLLQLFNRESAVRRRGKVRERDDTLYAHHFPRYLPG